MNLALDSTQIMLWGIGAIIAFALDRLGPYAMWCASHISGMHEVVTWKNRADLRAPWTRGLGRSDGICGEH